MTGHPPAGRSSADRSSVGRSSDRPHADGSSADRLPADSSIADRSTAERLNAQLLKGGMEPLDHSTGLRFAAYFELLSKWNRRLNLTAIRNADDIMQRHFVECIFCARNLPPGITTLLDYGSGAGFPGIPIACCRSEISVTLGESQAKKTVFLREVVRTLELPATVYAGRCESLPPGSFSAVALRAVDHMPEAVRAAEALIAPGGWVVLLIGEGDVGAYLQEFPAYQWHSPLKIPASRERVLLLGQR